MCPTENAQEAYVVGIRVMVDIILGCESRAAGRSMSSPNVLELEPYSSYPLLWQASRVQGRISGSPICLFTAATRYAPSELLNPKSPKARARRSHQPRRLPHTSYLSQSLSISSHMWRSQKARVLSPNKQDLSPHKVSQESLCQPHSNLTTLQTNKA